MELAVTKYDTVPVQAIPEATLIEMILGKWEGQGEELVQVQKGFSDWLTQLLSIKNTEENVDKLETVLIMVKESAWSLSISEMKKAFMLYVQGKLPNLEPRDNYLTAILFNKVVTAYKQQKKPIKQEAKVELSEEEKTENAYLNCIYAFDEYIQKGEVPFNYHTAYDTLKAKGMVESPTKKESDEILKISKSRLIRECSTNRSMKDTLRSVVNTKEEKKWVIDYGKCELLAKFFEGIKQQKKHLREIL